MLKQIREARLAGGLHRRFPLRRAAAALAAWGAAWLLGGGLPAALAQPLPLGEALSLAATTHPAVTARRSDAGAQRSALEAARWQRYPSLIGTSTLGQTGEPQVLARVQLPLWTGGRISADIDAARERVGAADTAITEAALQTMDTVVGAFTEIARTQSRLAVGHENIAEHERLVALIERRVQGEVSSEADLVLARSRLAQARTEQAQLEVQGANARFALEQATGRTVDAIVPPERASLGFASFEEARDEALRFSPQLRRLDAEARGAGADISSRKGALMPQLVARYDHAFASGAVPSNQKFYLGVEYQSGGGLSGLAQVREAEQRRQGLLHSREAATRELLARLRSDWSEARALDEQARVLQQLVATTQQVVESYNRQYAVGRKSWLEVLNAQREAASARHSQADARWGMVRAVLRLELATGRLLPPALAPTPGGS